MMNMISVSDSLRSVSALRVDRLQNKISLRNEEIAEELPVSISIREHASLGMTLCSPQDLDDLIVGFLFHQGIIDQVNDIKEIVWTDTSHCEVTMAVKINLPNLSANRLSHSACGICQFENLKHLVLEDSYWEGSPILPTKFFEWSEQLGLNQPQFSVSGGLHAAALFSVEKDLIIAREDIGRHNSLDKLVGAMLRTGRRGELSKAVLLLSGRAGFELIQKAARARIGIVAAIGAPSALALDLAKQSGITLLGFLRENHFNVYCHSGRIKELNHET